MVTIKEAQETVNRIVKIIDPISVTVFGSVAREGIGEDLDLLVVVDDHHLTVNECQLMLYRKLKRHYKKFTIDPFVVSYTSLNEVYFQGSPFLHTIAKEGRTLYMKNASKDWLEQAKEELNTAEYLLGGDFYKGACYHAQQAIEKGIKAKLIKKGWELEKTHSIARLVEVGKEYRIKLKFADEDIIFVDSIYRGRYPAEAGLLPLKEPAKEDAARAIAIARRLFFAGER